MRRYFFISIIFIVSLLCGLNQPFAQEKSIILQSTTSTANSGLYDYLLPIFTQQSGITVHVVAVGTGQAIKNAKNGDGDVLLVHAREDEEVFIAEGFGVRRFDVMYNDYIVAGPQNDPAGIRGMKDPVQAFTKIAATRAPFVSRGDDSGTHKTERSLWRTAAIDPTKSSGQWYREAGSSMAATINIAAETDAYLLCDRGTWISFRNKGRLELLVEGDASLYNFYGITLVNPKKHPHVKAQEGQQFIDWMIGPKGQKAIADFKIDGHSLFRPNAAKP